MSERHPIADLRPLRVALASLKRSHLATLPTPVEPLLLNAPMPKGSFIKRDDLSGRPGGNKIRKLEYLLDQSPQPVVTFGPTGSHHVLATVLMCHRLNRSCAAVLVFQPPTPHAAQIHRLICENADELISLRPGQIIQLALFTRRWHRQRAMIVWPGGTCAAGLLGYVEAGVELAEQVRDGVCPAPDEVWVPLGSGGTASGLALGLALSGLRTRVKAVRVATRLSGNRFYLGRLAARSMSLLRAAGVSSTPPKLSLDIEEGFIGRGYGYPTAEAQAAQLDAAALGIALETTYTAKTLFAMRGQPDDGRIRILLDTYGPPEKSSLPEPDAGDADARL